MPNLFRDAYNNANLSPIERATLRLIQGLVATFLVSAAPPLWTALMNWTNSTGTAINWGETLHTALAAGCVAVLLAGHKYLTAHNDVIQAAEDALTGDSSSSGSSTAATAPTPAVAPLGTAWTTGTTVPVDLGALLAQNILPGGSGTNAPKPLPTPPASDTVASTASEAAGVVSSAPVTAETAAVQTNAATTETAQSSGSATAPVSGQSNS